MKRLGSLLVFASCALLAPRASAQASLDQAKMLFSAGAKAYGAGQFNAAIQAFEEANRLVPRPELIFSIAQAHRRQYFLDKDGEHLKTAIQRYREYVTAVKEGGRIADAAQALAELEPIAQKTLGDPSAVVRPAAKEPARVMVMTQVENATIAIDQKPAKSGLAVEVPPGKHHVRTSAPGYFDDERDVQAVDNALVPVDVPLREKPARLVVLGASGAQVSIDGRPAGETPLSSPIQVPSGTHLVVVTKNGYKAYSQEIDLARDEKKELRLGLDASGQRVVSYALMIGGSAIILAGGVFTGAALKNQSDAQKIADKRDTGTITPDPASSYDSSRGRRDDWTKAAVAAFAVGGATTIAGLVLYLFDQPVVQVPPARFEEKKPDKPASAQPMEVRLLPAISPSFAGGALTGSF